MYLFLLVMLVDLRYIRRGCFPPLYFAGIYVPNPSSGLVLFFCLPPFYYGPSRVPPPFVHSATLPPDLVRLFFFLFFFSSFCIKVIFRDTKPPVPFETFMDKLLTSPIDEIEPF